MRKYLLLLFLTSISLVSAQQYSNLTAPVTMPVPPTVWEFAKYGNVPVSEYRGLVNLSIPLHEIQLDDVSIPLQLQYHSGGIRVSEEAGVVGLGWSFNLPTIIQQINDVEDYNSNTIHQKLPPFQGNPAIPPTEVYQPLFQPTGNGNHWSVNISQHMGTIGIQNIPFFTNVCNGVLIDHNGYYNTNYKYLNMIHNSSIVDSDPDLFTLNLNGVDLKFSRIESLVENYDPHNYELLPLEILNNRNEFKIELLTDNIDSTLNSRISGIKVTDSNGSQYFFNVIEKVYIGGTLSQNIYKLKKIITSKNKEIVFEYFDKVKTVGINKYSCTYIRRTSQPQTVFAWSPGICQKFSSVELDYFTNNALFITNDFGNNLNNPSTTHDIQDYFFLKSISTPNEKVEFTMSNRIDYYNMKKIDRLTVKNVNAEIVKSYDFTYDYFDSTSDNSHGYAMQIHVISPEYNTGLIDRFTKRLKLVSVKKEGENPYVFEYDDIDLPKKNSFSIDYWGFYNGANNLNFYPDLTDLGYPEYDENISNNFNSNLYFSKACSLKRVVYPTKGYTEFEYGLHEFDSLLFKTSNNLPNIQNGAGLRINKVTDFNHDGNQIALKSFNYFGGKNISKRIMIYSGPYETVKCTSEFNNAASILTCTINNFVGNSSNLESQYIGYDKVQIRESLNNDRGYIEKEFFNKTLETIFCPGNFFTPIEYYDRFGVSSNGQLLNEKVFNSNNQIVNQKSLRYKKYFGPLRYGIKKMNNGVRLCTGNEPEDPNGTQWNLCDGQRSMIHNVLLLTFYPIKYCSYLPEYEIISESFGTQTKSTKIAYEYDTYKNLTRKLTTFLPSNDNFEEQFSYTYLVDPFYITKNQLTSQNDHRTSINGEIKNYKKNIYEISNSVSRLKEIVVSNNEINSNSDNRLFIDGYDTHNNVIQYHFSNGINTSIIWGYKNTLPVVKIDNIDFNTIPPNLVTAIKNASDNGDSIALAAALNQLYTSLPTSCIIHTYQHIPMVGIKEVTKANQIKSTFEFDGVSKKLVKIFDNEGNLSNEFFYNFKQ